MSLNDPQWGRGSGSGGSNSEGEREPPRRPQRPNNDGPPDLEELWRDFNRRLNGLFGKKRQGSRGGGFGDLGGSPRSTGIGFAALVAIFGLIWLASGFYIVPEGQVGVVTTFGKLHRDDVHRASAGGCRGRVQSSELVDILSLRKVEVGTRGRPDRLKEALMLTDDENIVDIQFEVQYRIKDDGARDYLFNSRNPDRRCARRRPNRQCAKSSAGGRWTRCCTKGAPRSRARCDSGCRRCSTATAPASRVRGGDPERPASGAGAGGVRRRGQGRPGPRASDQRGPGLCQRRRSQGARRGLAADAGVRGLPHAYCRRAPKATPRASARS